MYKEGTPNRVEGKKCINRMGEGKPEEMLSH
jgi:hypothetical protein